MHKVIIADTSCFIILHKIGELELLFKVYGRISTTLEVALEFGDQLPDWVSIEKVTDKQKQSLLELLIDPGEASALALALERTNSLVILDDYKARKTAEKLGIHFTGTIGVIVKAKLQGVIPSIKPILEKMKQTNFRISPDIEILAYKEANE
jgi:predicted nucleic acid-binding protein